MIYKVSENQIADFQTNGHILLREVTSADEITFNRPIISEAVYKHSKETRKLSERDTYGKAFLQIANLWEVDEQVKEFVFARKFAQIAADLLGVEKVRLYHDQALFKESGGGYTPWHQDQFYWNLDTPKTITMWMPLVDVSTEMGLMKFAKKSHKNGLFETVTISNKSNEIYSQIIAEQGFEISQPMPMKTGDATFHYGHTIHSAEPNLSEITREVMTIIYFADGARITEPINNFQKADHERWLDSIAVGELANGKLNPIMN
jgi:ectoine hydroxylase-related dioxygenase (phytanoyl-CoA dioxygenase family)